MKNIDEYWCLNCGTSSFTKSGFTSDKRQRIKCKYCGTKTTIGARRKGEREFNENKLLPILRKNPMSLSKEEKYVMGVVIADGCFTQGHTFSYSVAEKDKDLIYLVKEILQIPNEVKRYTRKKSNTTSIEYQLRWRYKYSQPFWAQLGLLERKTSHELWLPYMESPSFVRGFFDGDGCLYNGNHGVRLSFVSMSENFLEKLNNCLYKYAGVSKQNIYMIHAKRTMALGLRYRKYDAIKICEWLYQDSENLRLERKYQKFLEVKNDVKKNR